MMKGYERREREEEKEMLGKCGRKRERRLGR